MTHHRNGYYLLYSGASFADASYAMGYAYASSPTGPFVKPSSEPILKSTADVLGPGPLSYAAQGAILIATALAAFAKRRERLAGLFALGLVATALSTSVA